MKKKEIIEVMIIAIIFIAILLVGSNRIEKIENGEMVLVNQNQMDR